MRLDSRRAGRRVAAFSLIELLVVIGILLILVAIALPNFLEAQTRSRVSRACADLRTMADALEAYRIDWNAYPSSVVHGHLTWLHWMTTPVAYLGVKDLDDPFTPKDYQNVNQIGTYRYFGFNATGVLNAEAETGRVVSPRDPDGNSEDAYIHWYMLFSHGPDRERNTLEVDGVRGTFAKHDVISETGRFVHFLYDASNGTRSPGELLRGGGRFIGDGYESGQLTLAEQ